MSDTVVCGGLTLPACRQPDCREPAAANWRVCDWHRPAAFGSLDDVAARINEFQLVRHSNGWSVEHWTGGHLPIPMLLEDTQLGQAAPPLVKAVFAPREAARDALEAYRQGRTPEPWRIRRDGSHEAPQARPLTLFEEDVA